ncbi:MAG: hypothetical protein OEQ28_03335, partial [Acidobacteriota bacterium]|nr:hypothetical protein [Acidobacteriota bacterium]
MRLISTKNGLKLVIAFSACLFAAGVVYSSRNDRTNYGDDSTASDGKVLAFGDPAKARKAFNEAAKVFFSPRCSNCHPSGDFPTQGDDMNQHFLDVVRGDEGKGSDD